MFFWIKDRAYHFKFGLKGLILLDKLLRDSEESLEKQLYCGFITDNPGITLNEIRMIINQLDSDTIETLKKIIQSNLLSFNIQKVPGLYSKLVGQVGVQPSEFFNMTEEEMNLAYKGFLEKKEIEANLAMTAINYSNSQSNELIRLTEEEEYEVGSRKEREETFKAIGIEVEE